MFLYIWFVHIRALEISKEIQVRGMKQLYRLSDDTNLFENVWLLIKDEKATDTQKT